MSRPFTIAGALNAVALAISIVCPAALAESLPPGTYVYLGEPVGAARPRLLTVTSGGKIKWQGADSTSRSYPLESSTPILRSVSMPRIGGQSIAPMSNSDARIGFVNTYGLGAAPTRAASNLGSTAYDSAVPVPVGRGANSLGYDRGPGTSPRSTRAGRGSGGGGAAGGGSPGIAVAPSVARAPSGSDSGKVFEINDNSGNNSTQFLSKVFFDDSDYPTRKWKPIGVAGHPEGVAQLNSTYEEPESVANMFKGSSIKRYGELKLRLILMKVNPKDCKTITVSILDKDGFSIADVEIPSFHEVPGTSLFEGQISKNFTEADYKRAYSYSVH